MKNIYIILEAQSSNWNGFNISQVSFVFTSKKIAMKQMDDIAKCVEHGQWWTDACGKSLGGEVLSDEIITDCHMYDFQRDLRIKSPSGQEIIYRLIAYNNINSNFEFREK